MFLYTPTPITFADTGAIDAFARLRTSEPFTIFGWKSIHGDNSIVWDDQTTAGTASSTYNTNESSFTLAVAAGDGTGTRVRQTKQRYQYEPGKSQLILLTFNMGGGVDNVEKWAGYGDGENGLFFRMNGRTPEFVVRSYTSGSAVDTVYAQDDWNLDPMNGHGGRSGITLDFEKTQILLIDFEWLGVGRIRFGWVIDGVPVYAHEVNNANNTALVYMSTPNLPIHYAISSSAAVDAEMDAICSSVQSEGGFEEVTNGYSIDRGITAFVTGNNTSLYPVLAYRLKATHLGSRVVPVGVSVLCTSTANFRWALILNPTVTGTALSFSDITNTAIQADVGTTNATTVSGGFVIASGYAASTNQAINALSANIPSELAPGAAIDGTRDVLVLAVQNLAAGAEDYYASLELKELT